MLNLSPWDLWSSAVFKGIMLVVSFWLKVCLGILINRIKMSMKLQTKIPFDYYFNNFMVGMDR
jgi:hypothetical protein